MPGGEFRHLPRIGGYSSAQVSASLASYLTRLLLGHAWALWNDVMVNGGISMDTPTLVQSDDVT